MGSKFDAAALPSPIRHIPGVVSVDSELAGLDPEWEEGCERPSLNDPERLQAERVGYFVGLGEETEVLGFPLQDALS